MSSSPVTPLLTTADGRRQLFACYRNGLIEDTVRFWFPRSVDTEYGGFIHCLDRDGTILDTDKSVWAQGRMCWMLFTLYNTVEQRPEWLEWGRRGLEFLDRHCSILTAECFFM